MKLRALERDYARTIAADIKNPEDDFELKGKFEKLSFNNVEFQNQEESEIPNKTGAQEQTINSISSSKQETDNHEGASEGDREKGLKNDQAGRDVPDDEEEEEEEDNCLYEKLPENEDQEEGSENEWQDPQQAEVETNPPAQIKEVEKPLDVEKIKAIMSKIVLPPPPWAGK